MHDVTTQALEVLPRWLQQVGEDAATLSSVIGNQAVPEVARRQVAGALCYLQKSLDLIPDGVEDLGLLDDAFVLRVSARIAIEQAPEARETDLRGTLARLCEESSIVQWILESDYPRFENFVRGLATGGARGRAVDEIISHATTRAEFVRELLTWARGYQAPPCGLDGRTLIKLRAFLSARLP